MKFLSPTTKKLFRLALPCILESLLIMSVSVTTSVIMGHVGKNEMTAVSMTGSLFNWLQFIYLGLGTGVTVVIGRLFGEEDYEGVKEASWQSVKIAILISIIISSLGFIFSDQLLSLFFSEASPEVTENIKIFLPYNLFSLPFVAFTHISNAAARGAGENRLALITNVAVNGLYTLFSYILIFGITFLGYPSLSTHGAGIAIFAARAIGPFIGIIVINIKKIAIFPKNLFAKAKTNYFKRIFSISAYSAIEQGIFQGGFVILQSIYLIFGTTFQAGYQISNSILSIFSASITGVSTAITILTTQALARKDFDEATAVFTFTKKMFFFALIPLGMLMFALAPYMPRIYSTEPDVIESATLFCRLFGITFSMMYYQSLCCGILRGAGDARYITITSCAGLWLARILPVYILANYVSGYVALTTGIVLDFATRSVLYHFRLRKGNWMHIKV